MFFLLFTASVRSGPPGPTLDPGVLLLGCLARVTRPLQPHFQTNVVSIGQWRKRPRDNCPDSFYASRCHNVLRVQGLSDKCGYKCFWIWCNWGGQLCLHQCSENQWKYDIHRIASNNARHIVWKVWTENSNVHRVSNRYEHSFHFLIGPGIALSPALFNVRLKGISN